MVEQVVAMNLAPACFEVIRPNEELDTAESPHMGIFRNTEIGKCVVIFFPKVMRKTVEVLEARRFTDLYKAISSREKILNRLLGPVFTLLDTTEQIIGDGEIAQFDSYLALLESTITKMRVGRRRPASESIHFAQGAIQQIADKLARVLNPHKVELRGHLRGVGPLVDLNGLTNLREVERLLSALVAGMRRYVQLDDMTANIMLQRDLLLQRAEAIEDLISRVCGDIARLTQGVNAVMHLILEKQQRQESDYEEVEQLWLIACSGEVLLKKLNAIIPIEPFHSDKDPRINHRDVQRLGRLKLHWAEYIRGNPNRLKTIANDFSGAYNKLETICVERRAEVYRRHAARRESVIRL